MEIRAISTFTDWTAVAGTWGRPGVCRIFEALALAGIRQVYWRVFNGGQAMYPSQVAEVQGLRTYEALMRKDEYPFSNRPSLYRRETEFTHYDPIVDAIEFARHFDIKLHLWYSLYEDMHGSPSQTQHNIDNPHLWQMDRDGNTFIGTFDWFYEEIRAYKLAIVDELLQYPVDGLLLDFVRHVATPSSDADGIHRFGYNPEIRAAFKEAHGADPLDLPADDPTWLAFKCEIQTSLVRQIRGRMDATAACHDLSLMMWPVDYRTWCCLDVPALTASGAVGMLTAMSLPYSFRPAEAAHQTRVLKAQASREDVEILPGMIAYGGVRGAHIEAYAAAAEAAGASGVMLYESHAMPEFGLSTAVRAINDGRPNCDRQLTAAPAVAGADVDWDAAPAHTDFLFHFGKSETGEPAETTDVRLVYTDSELVVRAVCSDADMATSLAPVPTNVRQQYFIDALGQRGPYYDQNSFNLLIDPARHGLDFFQFGATPRGDQVAATFIDETWEGVWSAVVTTSDAAWTLELRIPYTTLGVSRPRPGDIWSINLVRGVRPLDEIYQWFPVAGQKTCPHELGDLVFA
jgi:hypothetical protein